MNISRARQLRNNLTDAERRLWSALRGRQLADVKFRRQAPIGPYIVDFVSFQCKLIIELDGGQHTEQVQYDGQRTEWLHSQGFQVLRFWNHQVFEDLDAILELIWRKVKDRSPLPNPPHQGEGGGV
jgi:very-short-patch-repair endonuclease